MLRRLSSLVLASGTDVHQKSSSLLYGSLIHQLRGMAKWSVEREPQEYKDVNKIIDDEVIVSNLAKTKEAAKDINIIRDILARAQERSFLKNVDPG